MTDTGMMNFDTDLDRAGVARQVATRNVRVVEETTVRQAPNEYHTYQSKGADETWDWEALRDYVVDRIEFFHGGFPRDFLKEKSIFSRFAKEFGSDAVRIARFVFDGPAADGRWAGAPVSINRFCRGSDDFFGRPILEKIGSSR